MKRDNWPVEEEGIRPAGKPNECFYCHEPKGGTHKADCVIRKRTVVVELKIELVLEKPEDWDPDMIEFHLNESSSCQGNILTKLNELEDRLRKDEGCLCGLIKARYAREATPDDEVRQCLFASELPA